MARLAGPTSVGIVVLALVAPALLVEGIVATRAGGDSPFLLQRVFEISGSLADLHIPPRWMGDSAYGLGYPFWTYYGPLAYLVAGAIALLGGGVVGAIKVTTLWCFIGAGAGAYALAYRHWGRVPSAVLAAASYLAAPYHMVNVYVRGDALGELAAYAVLPWVLVAIDATGKRRSAALLLAFAVAALVLAHNVSALMFAPLVAAYALWRLTPWGSAQRTDAAGPPSAPPPLAPTGPPPGVPARYVVAGHGGWSRPTAWAARLLLVAERALWRWRRPKRRAVVALVGGTLLGLALAAWFWVPAVLGRDLVQLGGNLDGYFDYHGHYVTAGNLVQLEPAFSYGIDENRLPWKAGAIQVLIAAAGLCLGLATGRRRAVLVFWLLVSVASTWLMTGASRAAWETVPLMAYIQFPWRWLSVQALALAMLSAPLGSLRFGRGLAVAASAGLAAAVLVGLEVVPLGVRDVSRDDIRAFEVFSGNLGSTVRAEYLPAGVVPRPFSSAEIVRDRSGLPRAVDAEDIVSQSTLVRRGPGSEAWQLTVTGDAEVLVAFPTYDFPGWEATVDRKADAVDAGGEPEVAPQPVGSVPGSGWLTVTMPPGAHFVELNLARDDMRAVAEGISLLALGIAAAWYVADRRRRLAPPFLWFGATLALSIGAAWLMPRADAAGLELQDVLVAPYRSVREGGVRFGDTRLTSASLSREVANAGEDVVLTLGWENALSGYRVEAGLATPAEPVFGVPDVRSIAEQIQSDPVPLRLPIPEDVPSGMYFVRLRVTEGGQDVAPTGAGGGPLGGVYFGPVRVTGKGQFRETPARPVARMGDVVLHAVQAAQEEGQLVVTMFWETDRLLVRDYKTSVRLLSSGGDVVASDDKMPVYGFLPTTAWEVAEQIVDRRWLDLPDDVESGDDYRVSVVLYDEATGEEIGQGQVGGVRVEAP